MSKEKATPVGLDLTKQRNLSFDLLRICAEVMVVLMHVSASGWYALTPDRKEWMVMNFYDCLSRSAVPLFFMISGAFMLKKEVPLKNLYLKKIVPLYVIYLAWSFFYALDSIGLGVLLHSIKSFPFAKIIETTVNSHYHLWFLPAMIGIYMLHPVLHGLVVYKDGAYIRYFILLFIVVGVICPTACLFIPNEVAKTFLSSIPMELVGYSGYAMLDIILQTWKSVRSSLPSCCWVLSSPQLFPPQYVKLTP